MTIINPPPESAGPGPGPTAHPSEVTNPSPGTSRADQRHGGDVANPNPDDPNTQEPIQNQPPIGGGAAVGSMSHGPAPGIDNPPPEQDATHIGAASPGGPAVEIINPSPEPATGAGTGTGRATTKPRAGSTKRRAASKGSS